MDLRSEFFQAQGTNGRDCSSCHFPQDGWSVTREHAARLFEQSEGLHPMFNIVDADNPDILGGSNDALRSAPVEVRRNAYTMLRQGKFSRRVSPPAGAEFRVVLAEDPFGYGTTTRLYWFRRPLPTANFQINSIMWDHANTCTTVSSSCPSADLHGSLTRQAVGNVTGAQQGQPATPEVIEQMVQFEKSMFQAQRYAFGVGFLDAAGAKGGAEELSRQAIVNAPFDLYAAWANDARPRRRQIARGEVLFNTKTNARGGTCRGCHNAQNTGMNVTATLFNVGASDPDVAKPDMARYTLERIDPATGAPVLGPDGQPQRLVTTDPGRGIRTGRWADLNRFKTPTLRGLRARGGYFHGGTADTLLDVVRHYEVKLGFDFTPEEEEDLVAFMNAL